MSVTFNMTFSQIGDCPIVVEASTGGELPCQRDGEGTANAVAVDRLTRKLKVEVSGNRTITTGKLSNLWKTVFFLCV